MDKIIPEILYNLLVNQYKLDDIKRIEEGLFSDRYTTFRVNTLKNNLENIKNKLNNLNFQYEEVDWYKDALILKDGDIRKTEIYNNGEIYLQSLSSMLPPIVLEPKEKENILDMAAAPGGKTTQIAAITNNNAFITACEKNKIRSDRLKYNIEKQGVSKVTVLVKDATKLDEFFSFDKILLDAPCTGSGTINLNNNNIFREELLKRCVNLQKSLLKKAIKILKVGGELVYSTCSILKEENENVIDEFLKKANIEIIPINTEKIKSIPLLETNINGTVCVCPSKLYEGFFVAKIKKIKK